MLPSFNCFKAYKHFKDFEVESTVQIRVGKELDLAKYWSQHGDGSVTNRVTPSSFSPDPISQLYAGYKGPVNFTAG